MRLRTWIVTLAMLAVAALGLHCSLPVEQVRVVKAGFVEPHTPGSGAPVEFGITPTVQAIVGSDPDLNQTLTVRTLKPGRDPKVVLILMPGFLGGASSFDPFARDLVRDSRGKIQVWAIDRRSNQLEDRRGALTARVQVELGDFLGSDAIIQEGLDDGTRFYFSPVDLDGDTVPDPPLELPDESGGDSAFLRLVQDDARFAAYWGVDTVVRDWKALVDEARELVGEDGCVIVGGHSLGTTWAGIYAAYDFEPGPGVDAAYEGIDGLLLLEGGGPRGPSAGAPVLADYLLEVEDLASPGGSAVFLENLFGLIDAVDLGAAGEINGLAGTFLPDAPSVLQKTSLFGGFPISLLLAAPFTNEALVGFFLDDDFSTNSAFSASFGFSDNGGNAFNPFGAFFPGNFLIADTVASPGVLRSWKNFDDPTLPSCPPNDPMPGVGSGDVGCALLDNGPKPAPGDPPAMWGVEREVTDIGVFTRSLYETGNASEWYFVSGRPGLDFEYGRDSSGLGAPELLNVTQNANMDAPILAIGGSNGLTPTEDSFADYLGSVATLPADQEVLIFEGIAHIDVLAATDSETVVAVHDWVDRLRAAKDDDSDTDSDSDSDSDSETDSD